MSMASVSSVNVLVPFRTSSPSVSLSRKLNVSTPTLTSSRSVAASARRRNTDSPLYSLPNKKNVSRAEQDDVGGDAFEALFAQLEEDLKNDPSIEDVDGQLTEKELAKFQTQLEEAMLEDDDLFKMLGTAAGGALIDYDEDDAELKGKDEEEEDEDMSLKLKSWQLRRLARALKVGRRKTSIKSLAAELCLDRALVLELLRDPPPNLLMMSAMLSDEPLQRAILEPVPTPKDIVEVETAPKDKVVTDLKAPVHAMQSQWSTQKRLKKVQLQTLERVYKRTKRPTNTMINSIVHVTNLPRKKVIKWFEDKRDKGGVPNERLPYERSTPETVFSN